jgi:hypothetical protein
VPGARDPLRRRQADRDRLELRAEELNLRKTPRARILFDGSEQDMVARELDGEERAHWYERGIEIYPGWVQYRKRAAHRRIPVIELTAEG